MREGQRWFYEVSDFFSSFLPASQITYMGFENVNLRNGTALAGVFEFPNNFKFNKEFVDSMQGYSSDRVQFIIPFESINKYRHCAIVVLN